MPTNEWLQGRHALITGGGTGIGAAAATHLHAAGAKISVLGRRLEPLERTAAIVSGTAIQCDVTDRDAIFRAFDEARAANGPISFLIVNAGVGDSAPFDRTPREAWDRIIATNLTSAFDCAQAALPDLLGQEDGRMVFIASVAGLRGAAYAAPYAASKHGLIGLMRSLASEFAKIADDRECRLPRLCRHADGRRQRGTDCARFEAQRRGSSPVAGGDEQERQAGSSRRGSDDDPDPVPAAKPRR